MQLHIIAMAAVGNGLSGSDRIFIELGRNLAKKGNQVTVYVSKEGYDMCQRQKLDISSIEYRVSGMQPWKKRGFIANYLARIIEGVRIGLTLKVDNSKDTIIYSASDFWMDSLPGWILKIRFPRTIWIGTFYLMAPNPFYGFKEGGKKLFPSLRDCIYWLLQRVPFVLIKKYADLVCVTSEPDINRFPEHKSSGRYLIIKGGVNIKSVTGAFSKKIYDAVFQGRFHKQKGILELIDIWRKVVDKLPGARLALIGDGPLFLKVKQKIKDLNLTKNIILFGYLFDGKNKYKIFKQSKVVLHPAVYDSGGMAAAEAMAFGLPGVSFDLEALKSYYPKGMLKARVCDLDDFSDKIIRLLMERTTYNKFSHQAEEMIKSEWSWENRTNQFLRKINEIEDKKKQE